MTGGTNSSGSDRPIHAGDSSPAERATPDTLTGNRRDAVLDPFERRQPDLPWFTLNADRQAAPVGAAERLAQVLAAGAVRTIAANGELTAAGDLARPDEGLSGDLFRVRPPCAVAGGTTRGNAQPLTAGVLTINGWKRMGDITIGDALASPDGRPSLVTGVFPRGTMPLLRVTLSDRRSTLCSPDHLWTVYRHNHGRDTPVAELAPITVPAAELAELVKKSRPIWLPPYRGDHGHDADLPVEPYLPGLLLGDGCLGHGTGLSTVDEELIAAAVDALPPGMMARLLPQQNGAVFLLVDNVARTGHAGGLPNPLREALRGLGLAGTRAHEKFVPELYRSAPKAARLALLQGFLAADGSPNFGGADLTLTSHRLAQDAVELARSLGAIGTVGERSRPT